MLTIIANKLTSTDNKDKKHKNTSNVFFFLNRTKNVSRGTIGKNGTLSVFDQTSATV